jgi:hypothetical protein
VDNPVVMSGTVSSETCHAVFKDALQANDDDTHKCHYFIKLQRDRNGIPTWRWQLPVPFMGRTASAGIAFLGCNPNYGYEGDEPDPRIGCDFEEYDAFWRRYFDDRAPDAWPGLYKLYQRIGEIAMPAFRLGEDALVLEAVQYRCSHSSDCWRPGVWEHEKVMTTAILKDVAPRVIFCCGRDALWCVRDILPDLWSQLPDPFRIGDVEGHVFQRVRSPWGEISVLGCRHLMGVWRSQEEKLELGHALREALSATES